eukprot:14652768-Ditylum_brightwellii.AAC.1
MKKYWREEMTQLYSLLQEYHNSESDELTPCLPPLEATRIIGCDDKTAIPVGRATPVLAMANQSGRALVSCASGEGNQVGDHGWHCEAKITSVLIGMNRSADPRASLYSGGVD